MARQKVTDEKRKLARPIMLSEEDLAKRDDLAKAWRISGSAVIRRAIDLCHQKFLRKDVD